MAPLNNEYVLITLLICTRLNRHHHVQVVGSENICPHGVILFIRHLQAYSPMFCLEIEGRQNMIGEFMGPFMVSSLTK